ncbi:MAG: tRNA uridine-5-carboxymethylaminomethyl(34) synthesis GTPase MnmE, partial [Chthoniobacterales bacterium]|nr:tRNA uridine-5-carboxymethylaminomethyl(34) synthesis GTPase MnmE [Chthoniobacterales bacterium]
MSKYEGLPAIAAIATPNGTGAIAIVRLSGNNSLSIASEVFRSKVPLNQAPPRQVVLGKIVDRNGKILDTALAVRFAEPASYTGEDMVEISCHGGPLLVSRVLELLLTAGARLAEPGEFTLRAFLNGKLDLTQ